MERPTAESSAETEQTDKYKIDDTPLTQAEEEEIAKIEGSQPTPSTLPSPGISPSRKKRKRPNSASPHLTPSRLRSSVRATSRALDAGYKPNSNHSFRQEQPAVSTDASIDSGHRAQPPEPKEPQSIGVGGHPVNHPSAPVDHSRHSMSTGPSMPPPIIQPGAPYGYAGGIGDHTGAYPLHLQMPPSGMPQQYGAYPGVAGPTPCYQPPGPAYSNMQFHHYPPIHDHKPPRLATEMPTEGPNPLGNVFSPRYTPVDLHPPAQGPAPQLPPAQLSSSTSALNLTSAHGSLARSPTPSKPTPSESTPRPAPKTSIAEPADSPVGAPPPTQTSVHPSTPSSTPLSPSNSSPDNNSSKFPRNMNSTLEDSPTIVGLSKTSRKALQDGFAELDACIQRISAKTGLNPAQIVDRWDATQTRVANSWNIYQGFFEEWRDQELARLDPKAHPNPGAIPAKAVISACYDLFKLAQPENYDDVLRSWYRLRLVTEAGDISASKRTRDFKKHTEKIDALVRYGSSHCGFESICITVGGVVNQDYNLAQIIASDATFFPDRYRSSDNEAIAQLKAHVYDRLSKRLMMEDAVEDSSLATVKKEQAAATSIGESTIPSIHVIREKFVALAARHKVTVTKGRSLLWKALPQAIADAGCVLYNWPEDVPFPCDESQSNKSISKGISVLKLPARALLFTAFDHPTHPLRLEKKYKTRVPKDDPVLIGVPPSSSSPHTHGRRKFLNDSRNEDRQGPPRLRAAPQTASARASKPSAPPTPSKNAGLDGEVHEPTGPISVDSDEDGAAPKTSKGCVAPKPKSHVPSTSKPRVQFALPDDSDHEDYCASEGGAEYSGTEDDVPIVRSPRRLRSKTPSVKDTKRKQPTKGTVGGSTREEDEAFDASAAEIEGNATKGGSTANKRRRIAPAVVPIAGPAPSVESAPAVNPTSSLPPAAKPTPTTLAKAPKMEIDAEDHGLTDKLAAQLFGDGQHSSRNPDSAASSSADLASSSNATNETPAAVVAVAPTPQQTDNRQPASHSQAPRHEGFHTSQHPGQSSETYGGYWTAGSGLGWYPPAPSGAAHHLASGGQGYPPMGGGQGYPPPGAPMGQGYPPPGAPMGVGQGYPPGGAQMGGVQGYPPPGAPTAGGQGYPPPGAPTAGEGYPPPGAPMGVGQGYPPGGAPMGGVQGYPPPGAPTAGGQGYPPPGAPTAGGQGYPPPGAPTAGGQGYPPPGPPMGGGQGYPPPGAPTAGGQGYPPSGPPMGGGQGYPPAGAPMGGQGYPSIGGQGHHSGYWPPFPNPYGHYLPPGAPPSHQPQDSAPRTQGDAAQSS